MLVKRCLCTAWLLLLIMPLLSLSQNCALPLLEKEIETLIGSNITGSRYTCLVGISRDAFKECLIIAKRNDVSVLVSREDIVAVQLKCSMGVWTIEDKQAVTDGLLSSTFPTRGACQVCSNTVIDTLTQCGDCCWNKSANFGLAANKGLGDDYSNATCARTIMAPIIYSGLIVSAICLLALIIICTYSSIRNPMSRTHSFLIISFLVAVLGVNLSFIGAVHSIFIPPMCAVVACLFHFFFLVSLLAAVSEVLYFLLLKTEINTRKYWLPALVTSWLSPAIIVAVCIGPNYTNYTTGRICRPVNIPFFIGLLVPFVLVLILLWISLFTVLVCLCCKKQKSKQTAIMSTPMIIVSSCCALMSSLIFSIAWSFGFVVTSKQPMSPIAFTVLEIMFIIFTALYGILLLLLNCLKPLVINKVLTKAFHDEETDEAVPILQEVEQTPSAVVAPQQTHSPTVPSRSRPSLLSSSGRQKSNTTMNVLPSTSAKSRTVKKMQIFSKMSQVEEDEISFTLKEESFDED